MNRIIQLDSLRALAVLLVMFHHSPTGLTFSFLNDFAFGSNLFLVLSGFLITQILLHEKQKAARLGFSRMEVFKNFVVKRALRIFPLYFLVLLALMLTFDFKPLFLFSLFTFTTNFYIFLDQSWTYPAHLWSLAVQEQFYFLWPLVVLASSGKKLLFVIVGFILTGIISQLLLFPGIYGAVLTTSCFDALGLGALLAWAHADNNVDFGKVYKWVRVAALASLSFFFLSFLFNTGPLLPMRTLFSFVVLWAIASIIHKKENGLWSKAFLLNTPVLQFIGKISFGLYLLHPIIPAFAGPVLLRFNQWLALPASGFFQKLATLEIYFLIFMLAWLCYTCIELPFLRLKKYFVLASVPTPSGRTSSGKMQVLQQNES